MIANTSNNNPDNDNPDSALPARPVVFLLLDGWGTAPVSEANILASAKTSTFNKLVKEYPVALLTAADKTINARYLSLGIGRDLEDENIESSMTLSSAIAAAGLKQVKITETERLAALTHFFNGHREDRLIGEDWNIVSSEAGDHSSKPSLALARIIRELNKCLREEKYDFIAVAIPTLDLVASGGDFQAVGKIAETIDRNLKKIVASILDKNGIIIISAACGNAENMKSMATELIDKEMTDNPVPLVIVGNSYKGKTIGLSEPLGSDLSLLAPAGNLGDLAPTILKIMNLPQPAEMTGKALIE